MLSDLIIQRLLDAIGRDGMKFSDTTPNIANQAISQACQEYILGNVKVKVSYVGYSPSGYPDIVPDITLNVTGLVAPVNFRSNTSFYTWFSELWRNIVSGIYIAPSVQLTPTGTIPAFIPSPTIEIPLMSRTQKEAWDKIANSLDTWMTSPIQGGRTFPATRPGSVGTATIIKFMI